MRNLYFVLTKYRGAELLLLHNNLRDFSVSFWKIRIKLYKVLRDFELDFDAWNEL
jgi:hypothetical protein